MKTDNDHAVREIVRAIKKISDNPADGTKLLPVQAAEIGGLTFALRLLRPGIERPKELYHML